MLDTGRKQPPRVAIVGAGWAGLAAAVTLVERGAVVTLYEAGRVAGGRARGIELDNIRVDNGQHLLIGAYRRTLRLMRRVGVDPDTALRRLPMRVLVPGRFDLRLPRLPAPLHTAVGLLSVRGARWREIGSAVGAMRRLQASAYRLEADLPVSDWLDSTGQTGAIRRHLWEPLCLAALNTPPGSASAQVFANVLRDTLGGRRRDTDFLLPRHDLGKVLPEPATRWLAARGARLRYGCRVRALEANGCRWRVHSDMPGASAGVSGNDVDHAYDQVVLAVGPQHASALLPPSPRIESLREGLAAISYQPIATVYLRYPGRHRLPHPILLLPGPTGQWVVDRSALDDGSEQNGSLIAHVLSAHGDWEAHSDEELGRRLHAELRAVQPGLPAMQSCRVIREKRATFACTPDLWRPPQLSGLKGLWLAGDYTRSDYPGTLEAAVRSGEAVAEAIAGVQSSSV
ncbi:MAG TPA: hydroxysqualene dehydroxylase HpnE [Rhodocyclaceae bacterium]